MNQSGVIIVATIIVVISSIFVVAGRSDVSKPTALAVRDREEAFIVPEHGFIPSGVRCIPMSSRGWIDEWGIFHRCDDSSETLTLGELWNDRVRVRRSVEGINGKVYYKDGWK